jgi:hypothetical protein
MFRKPDLFPSSGEGKIPTLLDPIEGSNLNHKFSFRNGHFLEYRTRDKLKKSSNFKSFFSFYQLKAKFIRVIFFVQHKILYQIFFDGRIFPSFDFFLQYSVASSQNTTTLLELHTYIFLQLLCSVSGVDMIWPAVVKPCT